METELPTGEGSDCEPQIPGRGMVTHLLRSRGGRPRALATRGFLGQLTSHTQEQWAKKAEVQARDHLASDFLVW